MIEPIEPPAHEWNDSQMVYREWDEFGVVSLERPYTAEERAAAEERSAPLRNEWELRDGLRNVIDAATDRQAIAQEIIDTPNADIKANPQQHIVRLARVCKRQERAIIRLARIVGGLTDSTDTGTD